MAITVVRSARPLVPFGAPTLASRRVVRALAVIGVLALAAWAFRTSLGGRKLWKEDFFG